MTAAIRVLIADDQRVVREGLSMLVELMDGIDVIATAADGAEAVELAARERPDVVLMDLKMPNVDGTEATRRLAQLSPGTAVLVLTTYADDDSVLPALRAGRSRLPDQGRQRGADRGGDRRRPRRPYAPRQRRAGAARGNGGCAVGDAGHPDQRGADAA